MVKYGQWLLVVVQHTLIEIFMMVIDGNYNGICYRISSRFHIELPGNRGGCRGFGMV